jgi:hypothetical protein
MPIDCVCIQCGKSFKARPSIVNKGGGKFCSYKCGGAWKSDNMSGDNSPIKGTKWDDDRKENFKTQYVTPPSRKGMKLTEEVCKKMSDSHIGISPWNKGKKLQPLSEDHKKKISDGLKIDYILHPENKISRIYEHTDESKKLLSIRMTGNNHPFYGKHHTYSSLLRILEYQIGGFWYGNVRYNYTIHDMIRKMPECKRWVDGVLNRDNYRDVVTNEICIYPEAHHVIELDDIIKKYNIINMDDARKCKELWDINNGKTLCEKCHHLKTKEDMKFITREVRSELRLQRDFL